MVLPKQLNIMYTIFVLDVLFLVQNVLRNERSEMGYFMSAKLLYVIGQKYMAGGNVGNGYFYSDNSGK